MEFWQFCKNLFQIIFTSEKNLGGFAFISKLKTTFSGLMGSIFGGGWVQI